MQPDSTNAAVLARLRFIDFLLDQFGVVGRPHLMDFFGLSKPQASIDLARYQELAPSNIAYDASARTYRRTAAFSRLLP